MDKPSSNDFDGDGDDPVATKLKSTISLPESQLALAIQLADLQRPLTYQDSSLLETKMNDENARPVRDDLNGKAFREHG